VGAGVTLTGVDNLHPTGTVGIGTRWFLTPWLTMELELKDHIYNEDFKAGDSIMNNFVVHAGFGFWFPVGWTYEYAK